MNWHGAPSGGMDCGTTWDVQLAAPLCYRFFIPSLQISKNRH